MSWNSTRHAPWWWTLAKTALPSLAWLCLAHHALAQSLVERKKIPLDPAAEKAFAEFASEILPAKKQQLNDDMTAVIAAIAATVKLSPEESAALTASAKTVVEVAGDVWRLRFIEGLRPNYATVAPALITRYLHSGPPPLGFPVEGVRLPQDEPAWTAALKSTLGPERFAAWDKVAQAQRQARDREIAAHLKPWAEQGRVAFQNALQTQVDDLKSALSLPAAATQALDEAAKKEVDRVTLRQIQRAEAILRSLNDEHRQTMMGGAYHILFDSPPTADKDKEWAQEIAKILTPQQLTAWTTWRSEELRKESEEIANDLKSLREVTREKVLHVLERHAVEIGALADLPPDKRQALQQAAARATDSYLEEWARRMLKQLTDAPGALREQVLSGMALVGTGQEGENAPRTLPVWKDAVEQALTPEEKQRWETAIAVQSERASRALAGLFLAEMDKHVTFNSHQRLQLEPLVQKITQKHQEGSAEDQPVTLSSSDVFQWSVALAEDPEIAAILDPEQRQRWREAALEWKELLSRSDPFAPNPARAPVRAGPRKPEPQAVEAALSEYLHRLLTRERAREMAALQPLVDEVRRIGALSPADGDRLETAAKGTVETALSSWLPTMDNNLHAMVRDATPQSIHARLAALGNWSAGRHDETLENQPIWKNTVRELLPADRQSLWQRERQARLDYRDHALAAVVLAGLRRQCGCVTDEMTTRLEPLLVGVLKEYAVDIQNYFSQAWYLSGYACMVPLAGVPEKDLAAVLGPEAFKDAQQFVLPQALPYWNGIQQNHDARVRTRTR